MNKCITQTTDFLAESSALLLNNCKNVFGCVKRLKNDQAFWDAYEKIKKAISLKKGALL